MVIAVLDSGYSGRNKERISGGISFEENQGTISAKEDYEDSCGHGTAVTDLLAEYTEEDTKFFIVRILNSQEKCSASVMTEAFKYLNAKVECNLIHISAGVERIAEAKELKECIEELAGKGIYTVAAYANNGAVAYPAAFENVFGVDTSTNALAKREFEAVEGSIIDFRTSNGNYRVNWGDQKLIVSGSSFSSTVITAEIAKIVKDRKEISFAEVRSRLKERAAKVYPCNKMPQLLSASKLAKEIKKAVVFPFNKEVFELAGNEDMCPFEIEGYYTHKYDMNLGKSISQVLTYTDNGKIVENADDIPWDTDFDTLIIGHCDEISKALKKDVLQEIFLKAREHNKKVYSLASIVGFLQDHPECGKTFTFPYLDASHVPQNRFGKLRKTARPVVAVMGTSSKQGKFHVQLAIRKRLLKDGYKPYQIATEPTGYLFGMDYVYPMGYESTLYLQEQDAVLTLNDRFKGADDEDADIILCGSQSGTIPFKYDNVSGLTIQQTEFLMALSPDAAVLCINYDDDFGYIERTRKYIESLTGGKVINFTTLPFRYEKGVNAPKKVSLTPEEFEKKKTEIKNRFGVNLYDISKAEDMNALYAEMIDFF